MIADTLPAPLAVADAADPSIDDLDDAIVALAARLNAVTHDFLVLVRRFDERVGWLGWGFESCADWLHWRCDLSLSAAREKVRVAHALKTLPGIAMAFASGELSYSKVRALTRVARRENEDALLEFALHTTAARVEERCRELRCGTVASTDEAMRAHARRCLSLRRDPERGTITITVELPLETGELVDKVLDLAVEATASSTPELAEESWAAQRADALVALAKVYLVGNGEGKTATGTSDHYQVVVHVDESALRGGAGRSGLPLESVRRIGCDASRLILVEDERGEPLSVGRKSRVVPQAVKRALWARDLGCRFPGCGRRRFVDAHHVEHWSVGGETSLANLMLLCSKHHTLVHEGGFRIEKDYRDRWFFQRPDGRAVPACGYRAADMRDDDVDIEDDRYGVHSSVHPSAEGSRVAEPSAEVYRARQPSADVFLFTMCHSQCDKSPRCTVTETTVHSSKWYDVSDESPVRSRLGVRTAPPQAVAHRLSHARLAGRSRGHGAGAVLTTRRRVLLPVAECITIATWKDCLSSYRLSFADAWLQRQSAAT